MELKSKFKFGDKLIFKTDGRACEVIHLTPNPGGVNGETAMITVKFTNVRNGAPLTMPIAIESDYLRYPAPAPTKLNFWQAIFGNEPETR